MKRGINVALITQNINEIKIYNDIQKMSPSLQFTYYDMGQNITKLLDNNDLLIRLNLFQPPPNTEDDYWKKENLLNLNLLFFVNKVTTVFKKFDNVMYKFEGLHYNYSALNRCLNFATKKDLRSSKNKKESPLQIITQILKDIDYPWKDAIVNDTQKRIDFISSQTMSVKDCIDYLLRMAISPHDPPTYFVHNLKTNSAMLINNKTYEERLENPTNIFIVPGTADSKDLQYDILTEVSNLTNNSFNAGILSQNYLSEFTFRQFDQNTRKWNQTKYNYKIIDDMFNKDILSKSDKYESIFTIQDKVDLNDIKYDFPVHNEQKMYLFLRELQLGTNSITFDVVGNLTRDAGQYCNLNCSNEAQISRYQGLWNIYSCEHRWSGKVYTNQLVCYRTFAMKPLWDENQTAAQGG